MQDCRTFGLAAALGLLIGWIPCAVLAADGFGNSLATAYERNPGLQASRRNYEALTEELAKAMAGFYPTATAAYERGHQDLTIGSTERSSETKYRELAVEQPVFNGGSTYNSVKAARRLIEAGQAELSGVEQGVLLEAGTAYMDVYGALSEVQLNRKNVELLKENRRIAQERFDVGETTRTDTAQSEARLLQATAQMQQAEGQLATNTATFRRIVGAPAPEGLALPINLPRIPVSLAKALEDAKIANLTLSASKKRQEAAEYDVDSSLGNLLPRVSLIGSTSRQEGGGQSVFAGGSSLDSDVFLVRVNIPLYQSGAEYAQIRQNKSVREQRKFELIDTTDRVTQDLTRAWEQWITAQATLASNQSALQAAQLALEGVRQEQELGERTTLDVLDAEREGFQSEVNITRAARDEVVARLNILALLGRLTPDELGLQVARYDSDTPAKRALFHPIGF